MKNSFKAIKMVIKEFPSYIFCKIYKVIAGLIQTFVSIYIVDYIVQKYNEYQNLVTGQSALLNKVLLVILFTFILLFILNALHYLVLIKEDIIERRFTNKMNLNFFNKLSTIDYDFHESPEFLNDYMRSLEEGPKFIFNLCNDFLELVIVGLELLLIILLIVKINFLIILYIVGVGVLYFILRLVMSKYSFKYQTLRRPELRMANYSNRAFLLKDSIPDIKTTNIENILLENNDIAFDNIIKTHKKYISKRTVFACISDIIITLIYPCIVLILAYSTIDDLEVSSFASLTVAATLLSTAITRLASYLGSFQENLIEVKVPFNLLSKTGKIEGMKYDDLNEDFNDIKIENISFSYNEKDKALDDVSMDIKKGEKIAIVGINGAGKTTLVKLLLRLYDVDSGSIKINGKDYKKLNAKSIRKIVGAVFQNVEVYAVSIAENVLLRKVRNEEDKELVNEALKFSGLYDYVYSLPNNINTVVTREFIHQGIVFSGGNKQKLAISRGYAQNYQLFILDEPSSSLDPLAEAKVYNNMLELGKNKTMVFISHRLTTTVNADKIYLFEDGKIKEQGTHLELMEKNGTYKKMFESQASKYLGEDNE